MKLLVQEVYMLQNKTVLLGVTGGIAAYKMADVASSLVKLGASVHVIMTRNATNFINLIQDMQKQHKQIYIIHIKRM